MKDNYEDIIDAAKMLPIWWDVHGVPRFREPTEKEAKDIRRIRCQECHRVFSVKLTDCYGVYNHHTMSHDIPEQWYYGDPPFHGNDGGDNECHAGYCECSDGEWEWGKNEQQH